MTERETQRGGRIARDLSAFKIAGFVALAARIEADGIEVGPSTGTAPMLAAPPDPWDRMIVPSRTVAED